MMPAGNQAACEELAKRAKAHNPNLERMKERAKGMLGVLLETSSQALHLETSNQAMNNLCPPKAD